MVFMRLLSKYKLPEGSTLELITEPKARLLTLVEPEGIAIDGFYEVFIQI